MGLAGEVRQLCRLPDRVRAWLWHPARVHGPWKALPGQLLATHLTLRCFQPVQHSCTGFGNLHVDYLELTTFLSRENTFHRREPMACYLRRRGCWRRRRRTGRRRRKTRRRRRRPRPPKLRPQTSTWIEKKEKSFALEIRESCRFSRLHIWKRVESESLPR